MDMILEEISSYEVKLEDDPTQPHLGTRYLQKIVAQCRSYLNRVTFYHQEIAREEKRLKLELKVAEMDLEFKTKEKLADDSLVRQQPSIADREALAATQLKEEHENVARLRVELMNVQESLKLVKFKHGELSRTSQDIRMQRALVKDDMDSRLSGGDGYARPQSNQDRTVSDGLPAPIPKEPINPRDLLDPERRPDDMPEPVDSTHADMIANFFNGPARVGPVSLTSTKEDSTSREDPPKVKQISYDDLLS